MWVNSINNLINKLKDKESSYNHTGYLMANNLVMISSQFIFAPFLTRIYSPEAYGLFSILFAFATNFSTLITLSYERSLFLEAEQKNRDLISGIVSTYSFLFCVIFLFIISLAPDKIANAIGITGDSAWSIFLLPLFVFVYVLFNFTGYEVSIKKKFKDAFVWGAPGTVGSKLFTLGYGYTFGGHFSGLYLGDILMRFYTVVFRLAVSLKKSIFQYFIFGGASRRKGLKLLFHYKRFPLYEMPATYFSLFVSQAPIYFLTYLKSNNIIGWLGISISLLDAPLRLISYSLSPVLMQKLADMRNDVDGFRRIFEKVLNYIFFIILVPSVILFFYGEDLFGFFFGKRWETSGLIASSYIFFYMFRFEFDLLYNVITVMGYQKKKFQVFLIDGIVRVALLIITYLIILDPLKTIIVWACESAIVFFFINLYAYKTLGLKLQKLVIIKTIATIVFLLAFLNRFIF